MAALNLFTLLVLSIISNVVFTWDLNIKHNFTVGVAQKVKVSYANLKIIRKKVLTLAPVKLSKNVRSIEECFREFLSCGSDCKSINLQVRTSIDMTCRILDTDHHASAGTCLTDYTSSTSSSDYYYIASPCDRMTCPPETHRCIPNHQQNTDECVYDSSVWSEWSECSTLCGAAGKQTRTRNHRCDEERDCQGACEVSTMENPSTRNCLLPYYSTCDLPDNGEIEYQSSRCSRTTALFKYDQETGKLVHKCSNKTVCWKNLIGLVVSDSCPEPTSTTRFFRNYMGLFQLGTTCFYKSYKQVKLGSSCWNTNDRIDFSTLLPGRVKASAYEVQVQNFTELFNLSVNKYPGNAKYVGRLDLMDVPRDSASQFVVRIQTYFIAPLTGAYEFVATCAYHCKVYISANDQQAGKAEIISVTESNHAYQDWQGGEFTSTSVNLNAGSRYYMEGIVIGKPNTLQHFSIGAITPDQKMITPITHNYMEEYK